MIEMVLETSVQYRHLTRLIAREDFIEFICRESSGSYIDLLRLFYSYNEIKLLNMPNYLLLSSCSNKFELDSKTGIKNLSVVQYPFTLHLGRSVVQRDYI